MKKLLFLSLITALLFIGTGALERAKAQAPVTMTTTGHGNALDTVTNTATVVTTPFRASTFRTGLVVQLNTLKISGTVAGTLGLYGSLDQSSPTHWSLIGSATSVTDASKNYRIATTEKWYYFQIQWTGTGTMAVSMAGKYWTY